MGIITGEKTCSLAIRAYIILCFPKYISKILLTFCGGILLLESSRQCVYGPTGPYGPTGASGGRGRGEFTFYIHGGKNQGGVKGL